MSKAENIRSSRRGRGVMRKCATSIRLTPFIYSELKELSVAYNTNVATLIRTLLLHAIAEITRADEREKQM